MAVPGASRRTGWRFVGLVLLGGSAFVIPLTASGAQTSLAGFVGRAQADGGRVTFSVPGFAAVEDVIDGGGTVSQSVVDSQSSSSFASLPYPGELAIAGPGLFATVTGREFPGAYPFFVSASHPTAPKQELADPTGAYRLAAEAREGRAGALAQFHPQGGQGGGGGAGGTRSVTSSVVEGDTVTTTAETSNEALDLGGGALRIASVHSRSITTYRAGDPKPLSKTEFVLEGGSAGGTSFAYGPAGLVVAGQGIPIPAGSGLDRLNTALEPAGVHLRFAGAEGVAGGATAGAFEIRLRGQAPVAGAPPGIIRLRLGGATTSVALGEGLPDIQPPAEARPGAGEFGPSPADGGGTTPTGPAATTAASGAGTITVNARPAGSDGLDRFPSSSAAIGPIGADIATPGPGVDAMNGVSAAGLPSTQLSQPILVPRRIGSDTFVLGAIMATAVVLASISSLWRLKGGLPG